MVAGKLGKLKKFPSQQIVLLQGKQDLLEEVFLPPQSPLGLIWQHRNLPVSRSKASIGGNEPTMG
jgi:hypothetical protein